MLTLGVLGIRLALGAQTEREGVKLQPNAPPTPSRDTLPLFPPDFPFYPCFFKASPSPRHCPNSQPGALIPTRGCFTRGCPTAPSIPTWKSWLKPLQAPFLSPLKHTQQPHDCSGCFIPRVFPCRGWGASLAVLGGSAPTVTYLGWVPGTRFWGPGRAARPGGARSGFGVASC